jgi:hypothetical protein
MESKVVLPALMYVMDVTAGWVRRFLYLAFLTQAHPSLHPWGLRKLPILWSVMPFREQMPGQVVVNVASAKAGSSTETSGRFIGPNLAMSDDVLRMGWESRT